MRTFDEMIFDILADEIEWEGVWMGIEDLHLENRDTGNVTLKVLPYPEPDEAELDINPVGRQILESMEYRRIKTVPELIEHLIEGYIKDRRLPITAKLVKDGEEGWYRVEVKVECPNCSSPDIGDTSEILADGQIASWYWCNGCDWENNDGGGR